MMNNKNLKQKKNRNENKNKNILLCVRFSKERISIYHLPSENFQTILMAYSKRNRISKPMFCRFLERKQKMRFDSHHGCYWIIIHSKIGLKKKKR